MNGEFIQVLLGGEESVQLSKDLSSKLGFLEESKKNRTKYIGDSLALDESQESK